MNRKPTIGMTTGDPKGIGPEIVALALEDPEIAELATFRIFGARESDPFLKDEEAAAAALEALSCGVEEALQHKIDILVTAPVNKARLRLVDKNFIGHTEFLASKTGSEACAMFVTNRWRVALVTRHLALKEVPFKLNGMDILRTLRLLHAALQKHFGILEPKIAVAGLNPHAGEEGILGEEEIRIIRPAVMQARKEGLSMEGPLSPDTLFWRMTQGVWDGVVAMYHDQGLIPLKTLAFRETVQVTLGLPFLRLSVDHGTAEELVGKKMADPRNMKAVIRLACQLAAGRRDVV